MDSYLTSSPISVESLLSIVQSADRGGTCVFLGTVRGDEDVTAIDYSAYDDMAVAEIERILAEAAQRWKAARVTLQHRLGLVPVGETSIGIAAAAPHRDVKQRLPVWKKELHGDGSATWVDPSGKPVAGVLRDR